MNTDAQNVQPTPLEVVQAQLDAYNKQDVKAFAAVFAPDVKIYNRLGDTIPSLTGREAVEKRYKELFDKYPKNYSTLAGRIVEGNYVIDHEVVTGREQTVRIVAIYEVKDGMISRCWFIR
ncbi:MAG: nuclear transport factor 2 family protein [Chitinophagaceae bacterium]|nr:nuclear transport factor 2 family protein [Chitinophagaceae bacterium]